MQLLQDCSWQPARVYSYYAKRSLHMPRNIMWEGWLNDQTPTKLLQNLAGFRNQNHHVCLCNVLVQMCLSSANHQLDHQGRAHVTKCFSCGHHCNNFVSEIRWLGQGFEKEGMHFTFFNFAFPLQLWLDQSHSSGGTTGKDRLNLKNWRKNWNESSVTWFLTKSQAQRERWQLQVRLKGVTQLI